MAQVQYDNDTSGKCTVTPNTYTRFKKGTTITITANSGYHFTNVNSPYLSWYDVNGSRRTTNMSSSWFTKTLSADNKTITLVSNTDFSTDIRDITCMQTTNNPIEPDTPDYPILTLTKNLTNVSMTPDETSIEIDGTSKIITLSANSGYQFSDVPKLTISGTDYNFTLSNDVYTLDVNTIGISADTSGTITATATEITVNPILTITKNLTNVTMSPDVTSIEIDGTSKIITLTADSGYQFSDVPKLTISGTDYNFTLSNDVYTLDVNTIGISADTSGTITATATEITVNPILTITKNLTNVTMSPDVTSIEIDGTSKIITLTADNGYEFSGIPYFEWNRQAYYFEQSGNSYIYDLNTLINENASIKIYATATATAKTKDVTNSLTNCTITPPFNVMVENETYNLTLNADNGFKFVTTPTLTINNRDRDVLDFNKVTDYQYILSFTAQSNYFDNDNNAVLSGVAVEETPIVNKYGAIQVYNPSTSDMASLATKRFKENGTVSGVTYSDVDLGNYITQFKRVFFNVVTSTKQNILLGVHDTLINTDTVSNDDVTIDCGTVFLEGANGNELDTKIYKIKIVLPFYEVIELPSIYMNKTIHIVYQANVITGYADILINEVVDNTDLLIIKYRCKVSQDLPYILDYDKLNGALSDMQLNTSPKIILQKNNTFIDKGYTTYKKGLISNEVGYFEVKDIVSMTVNATQKEKDLIENLLKSGVYL